MSCTTTPQDAATSLQADLFVDPLCAWSRALWPHWQRLLTEHSSRLHWRLRLGGMIHDWDTFQDPLLSVSRPAQMGPLWLQIQQTTGLELDARIWSEDPPRSSIPACLAVKAAQCQSGQAAVVYLHRLWTAVMQQRRNIADPEVLIELAQELAEEKELLNIEAFVSQMQGERAIAGLRADMELVQKYRITRFPTVAIRNEQGEGRMLTGYRPYEVLAESVNQLVTPTEQDAAL